MHALDPMSFRICTVLTLHPPFPSPPQVGADLAMVLTLTVLMLPRVVSVQDAISGFSNEGLLTVIVLFVVAGGISQTGGLDWYMAKILGRPKVRVCCVCLRGGDGTPTNNV